MLYYPNYWSQCHDSVIGGTDTLSSLFSLPQDIVFVYFAWLPSYVLKWLLRSRNHFVFSSLWGVIPWLQSKDISGWATKLILRMEHSQMVSAVCRQRICLKRTRVLVALVFLIWTQCRTNSNHFSMQSYKMNSSCQSGVKTAYNNNLACFETSFSHETVQVTVSTRPDNLALLSWPLRSQDLTPCDLFLWGFAKDKAYLPPYHRT